MTDITELATAMKAAAEKLGGTQWQTRKGFSGIEVIVKGSLEKGTGCVSFQPVAADLADTKTARAIALFSPSNVLALVEALELKEEQRANWFQMAQKLGEDLDAAEKRNAELESSGIAPGILRCTECSFVQTKNIISVTADIITAVESESEPCPNGCGQLQPVTWKALAIQLMFTTKQGVSDFLEAKKRIAELESFRTAYMEWSDKTDWVQTDKRFDVLKPWGKHRADVLKSYIEHLESRTFTAAAVDVLAERQRQVTAEGWAPAHDDEYEHGELADAAGCYALSSELFDCAGEPPRPWPWPDEWWKPTSRRRDLVKAGALILAEIERIDRAGSGRKGKNQPGMVVAVHIDAGDFVKFRGQVYEVKETDFDDHDVTLWFVCGEALKCAAGCQIEVVTAPEEAE